MSLKILPLVGTMLLLAGCSHQFTPTPSSQDLGDRDPDGVARVDRRREDRQQPIVDGPVRDLAEHCDPLPLASPPFGDCAQTSAWTCVGVCQGAARLACLRGSPVREIRCHPDGRCECRVGQNPAVDCPGGLDNGRTGCDRARELLGQGCCKP